MNELRELAQGYVRLLAGALALRAKRQPTELMNYDPLAQMLAQLALCLRNPNSTFNELVTVVNAASTEWAIWHENTTRFLERVTQEDKQALEAGDFIAELGELHRRLGQ